MATIMPVFSNGCSWSVDSFQKKSEFDGDHRCVELGVFSGTWQELNEFLKMAFFECHRIRHHATTLNY